MVIPESRRITHGGDSGSSDYMELLSDWFVIVEAAYFMIFETGSGILVVVT